MPVRAQVVGSDEHRGSTFLMTTPSEDFLFFRTDLSDSNFRSFLFFFRCNTKNAVEAFEWAFSVSGKVSKMEIAYEDIYLQIPKWQEEKRILSEQGFSGFTESTRLALRYETYLNSIYSLCENISKIVRLFYPKENLPYGFHDQKKRFLDHLHDDPYTKILTNTNWYDEVQAFRSEATHFLSGHITYDKFDNPGYFNRVMSQRNGAPSKVSKENLLSHVEELNQQVFEFLEVFGSCFLNKFDPDSKGSMICVRKNSTGQIYSKTYTLGEIQSNEPGTCSFVDIDCPRRMECPAYEKLLLSLDLQQGSKSERSESGFTNSNNHSTDIETDTNLDIYPAAHGECKPKRAS